MAKTSTNKKTKVQKDTGEECNEAAQDVISLLQECHNSCRRMFLQHASKGNGQHLSFLHLKQLQACIEICGSTASYLLKNGIMAYRLCEIAASICEECADSCEQMDKSEFEECAELCRETAEACLEESLRLRQVESRRRNQIRRQDERSKAEFELVKGHKDNDKTISGKESDEERGAQQS